MSGIFLKTMGAKQKKRMNLLFFVLKHIYSKREKQIQNYNISFDLNLLTFLNFIVALAY